MVFHYRKEFPLEKRVINKVQCHHCNIFEYIRPSFSRPTVESVRKRELLHSALLVRTGSVTDGGS